MKDYACGQYRSTRIHAVILTQDRSAALERCVDTALSTLSGEDAITILDDSHATMFQADAKVLASAARDSIVRLTHLRVGEVHDAIAQAMGGLRAIWQLKTAPRDIAPLRNLSLLIATAVNAQTTVLIDDDIRGFNLEAAHCFLNDADRKPGGLVVGAQIGGTTEQDTVTRLSDALHNLESKKGVSDVHVQELFRVNSDSAMGCGCISAGFMAFRLPSTNMFAFPPGYNEDWLWCLLHEICGDTAILSTDTVVVHDPPLIRRPTREDILFELTGDLILDSLVDRRDQRPRAPYMVLEDLANHAPDPTAMPLTRAKALLEQAKIVSESGFLREVHDLGGYGLGLLEDSVRSGELEMDVTSLLRAWSHDAIMKHRDFAKTLGTAPAQFILGAMMQEGRL